MLVLILCSHSYQPLRFFNHLVVLVSLATALAYASMATSPPFLKFYLPCCPYHSARETQLIHFYDWTITTPLILLCLTVLSGVSGAEIFFALIIDLILIHLV